MGLPLEEYRGFFTQAPETDQSSDDPAAEPAPRLTQYLKDIVETANAAWTSSRNDASDDIAALAEIAADACRQPSWRLPVGDSGLLTFFLTTVLPSSDLSTSLQKQSLRLIGNACAECEENQERAVESGELSKSIIGFLKSETTDIMLLPFALAVIYNIAMGNDKAVIQLAAAELSRSLLYFFMEEKWSGARFKGCRQALHMITELFEALVASDDEHQFAHPHTPFILLKFAVKHSSELKIEEFTGLITVALAYLTFESFQKTMVEHDEFEALQAASEKSCVRFAAEKRFHPEIETEIQQFWTAAANVYADMSSLAEFREKHTFRETPRADRLTRTPEVKTFYNWLADPEGFTHLQTVACLALGNLAVSDLAASSLLHVAPSLIRILERAIPATSDSTPAPVLLHAAIGALKNLGIPARNRPELSDALLQASPEHPVAVLPSLWARTAANPQLQFAVITLTRILLIDNPFGARALGLSPSPTSPTSPTDLHLLLTTAQASDAEPTHLEAARALCWVLRVLHSPKTDLAVQLPTWPSRAAFYEAHRALVIKALTAMMTHKKAFPGMRAEALFILALLSGTPEGGRLVLDIIAPRNVFFVIMETMMGCDRDELADVVDMLSISDDAGAAASAGIDKATQTADSETMEEPAAATEESTAVNSASSSEDADDTPETIESTASNAEDTATSPAAPSNLDGAALSAPEPVTTPGTVSMTMLDRLGNVSHGLKPQDDKGGLDFVRRNWENGMVLSVQLLKQYKGDLDPKRIEVLEDLFLRGQDVLKTMSGVGPAQA